jgi:hypothetical protein
MMHFHVLLITTNTTIYIVIFPKSLYSVLVSSRTKTFRPIKVTNDLTADTGYRRKHIILMINVSFTSMLPQEAGTPAAFHTVMESLYRNV